MMQDKIAQRRVAVAAWQRSGQSAARWAREQGLAVQTLHSWIKKVRDAGALDVAQRPAKSLRVAEVLVEHAARDRVVITARGVQLQLDATVDGVVVQRLVAVLVGQ